MRQIRTEIYETNSSSSHSLSISKQTDGMLDSLSVVDGTVILTGGSFNHEWKAYNDALTKANYCAVTAILYGHNESASLRDMLRKCIMEQTGAKQVEFKIYGYSQISKMCACKEPCDILCSSCESNVESYIDHVSTDVASKAFSSEEALRQFIFNPDSWLYIGNDNEEPPLNFYDKPGTHYKYELHLEGCTAALKLPGYPNTKTLRDGIMDIFTRGHYSYDYTNTNDEFVDVYGNHHDSFAEFDNGILVIFHTRYVDCKSKYLGYSVDYERRLHWSLKKIDETKS